MKIYTIRPVMRFIMKLLTSELKDYDNSTLTVIVTNQYIICKLSLPWLFRLCQISGLLTLVKLLWWPERLQYFHISVCNYHNAFNIILWLLWLWNSLYTFCAYIETIYFAVSNKLLISYLLWDVFYFQFYSA